MTTTTTSTTNVAQTTNLTQKTISAGFLQKYDKWYNKIVSFFICAVICRFFFFGCFYRDQRRQERQNTKNMRNMRLWQIARHDRERQMNSEQVQHASFSAFSREPVGLYNNKIWIVQNKKKDSLFSKETWIFWNKRFAESARAAKSHLSGHKSVYSFI